MTIRYNVIVICLLVNCKMSERGDQELEDFLVKRAFNITASKMSAIVAEYSKDPYWSKITPYSDAFGIYTESLMTREELLRRSKEGSQHYSRFGNHIEPFIYNELTSILGIDSVIKPDNVIYNEHIEYEGEEKIACTPDYVIRNLPSYVMNNFNRLEELNNIKDFAFVTHPDFHVNGNSFLLECKAKSLVKILEEFKRDKNGNLVPSDNIILQLQTQLLVTGLHWGIIGTLMFTNEGLKFHFYFMNADLKIQQVIKEAVANYFKDIKKGILPIPKDRWVKSLDYFSVEKDYDIKSNFLVKPREFKVSLATFKEKEQDVLNLLKEITSLEESLRKKDKEIEEIKNLTDKLKIQKQNLDKYLQLSLLTQNSYEVEIDGIEGSSYRVRVDKKQDYVAAKEKVIKPGDIIKKGDRSVKVTKIILD